MLKTKEKQETDQPCCDVSDVVFVSVQVQRYYNFSSRLNLYSCGNELMTKEI